MFCTPIDAEKNSKNFGVHIEYGDTQLQAQFIDELVTLYNDAES